MKKKILVVEDDQALNDAFTMILANGYDVDAAFDGQEALDLTKNNNYDLILLDLLMPVMDGKAFLRAFKNDKQIPIVVFSNLDAKTDIEEVTQLGAHRYMLKSWASPKELLKLVEDTLA
jgi:two-component system response regulator VicR